MSYEVGDLIFTPNIYLMSWGVVLEYEPRVKKFRVFFFEDNRCCVMSYEDLLKDQYEVMAKSS